MPLDEMIIKFAGAVIRLKEQAFRVKEQQRLVALIAQVGLAGVRRGDDDMRLALVRLVDLIAMPEIHRSVDKRLQERSDLFAAGAKQTNILAVAGRTFLRQCRFLPA